MAQAAADIAVQGSPSTQCYWVIDDSGSMSHCQAAIRNALLPLVETPREDVRHAFICFSSTAIYGEQLRDIRCAGSSTDIESGFSMLNSKLLANMSDKPSKIMVVFVSDGEDTTGSHTIVQRLKALGGTVNIPGMTCVLFTVAVGSGFPTNMVVDALRPNYHNASDYLPLVFPYDYGDESTEVFAQLWEHMWEVPHTAGEPPQVDATSSSAQLERAAKAIYNCHVMRASRQENKDQAVSELTSAKAQLENIAAIVKQKEAMQQADLAGAKKEEVLKPLVSRLINKYKAERSSGLSVVQLLLQQLNQLIAEAVQGKLLARLSDAELAKALGYGNVAGKYLAKSSKYNSAEFARTKSSLLTYLSQYGPEQEAADAQVADYLMTQAESITDAKAYADDIHASDINSIVGLVDVLAVIGRALQVKTCDGSQINPWLVQVTGMPHIMKTMNSVDFYTQHQGQYNDPARGEEANCLLPITTNPHSILRQYVGQHLTTFFLVKNEALCFSQSLASLVAATVTYCLSHPQPLPSWVQDELNQAMTTYEFVYHGKGSSQPPMGVGNKFLARLASPDTASTALCTEQADDPIKCEHLTKAVLGLLVLLRRRHNTAQAAPVADAARKNYVPPYSHTSADLRQLMLSFMAEMVGRSIDRSKGLTSYLPKPTMRATVQQLLNQVPTDDALKVFTLAEAMHMFSGQVTSTITKEHADVGIQGSIEELLSGLKDLGVSHFQFNERSVTHIFTAIDKMAGNAAPQDYFRLTAQERLSILAHALTHTSSAERCAAAPAPYDMNELEKVLVREHIRKVVTAAPDYIKALYTKHMVTTHSAPMLHFPQSFTARYQEETGRDIEAELAINPETRLPRNVCANPTCACFLKLCKPAHTPEGQPKISDQLRNHLETASSITAYTRTMVAHLNEPPEKIVRLVTNCSYMLPASDEVKIRARKRVQKWAQLKASCNLIHVPEQDEESLNNNAGASATHEESVSGSAGGPAVMDFSEDEDGYDSAGEESDADQNNDVAVEVTVDESVIPELERLITEDIAAYRDAEARWGGYEGFKAMIEARLQPMATA